MFIRRPAAPDRSAPGVAAVLDRSYPDFVAFIGQHNTPPGAYRTIDEWVRLAGIDGSSRLLDLACTTGYSGRTTHEITTATVDGIDISADAVRQARSYAGGNPALRYQVADATELPFPDASFTHILAGCNFGFIQDRDRALDETHRVLLPGGLVCTAAFYYRRTPPESLLDRVAEAIGFRPDGARDRDFWTSFFNRRFELVDEVLHETPQLGERRVSNGARRAAYGRTPALRDVSRPIRDACFHRLRSTRLVLDEHRRYQGLVVGVWRCRS